MTKEEIMQDLVYRQNNIDKIKQLEEDIKDGMYDDNHLIDLVLYYKNEIELLEKENMADNYTKYIEERDSKIDKAIEYMKLRFMNCIDNEKRYFEDYYIQEIYEILKGDVDEGVL